MRNAKRRSSGHFATEKIISHDLTLQLSKVDPAKTELRYTAVEGNSQQHSNVTQLDQFTKRTPVAARMEPVPICQLQFFTLQSMESGSQSRARKPSWAPLRSSGALNSIQHNDMVHLTVDNRDSGKVPHWPAFKNRAVGLLDSTKTELMSCGSRPIFRMGFGVSHTTGRGICPRSGQVLAFSAALGGQRLCLRHVVRDA